MANIERTTQDRIAQLTLTRPAARNALSPELLEELIEACEALQDDKETQVVVLRGGGGVFSAGADLPGFMARLHGDRALEAADLGRKASEALLALPQITVAAIEGHCVGGGLVLATSCDVRWSSADAWFSVPELDLGVPLAWGGMERLIQVCGETVAMDLVLSCRRITAPVAHRSGLVSHVFETDFESELTAQLETLAKRPAGILRTTKTQLQNIRRGTFDATTDAAALLRAIKDPESQRAAQAYMQRRASRSRNA